MKKNVERVPFATSLMQKRKKVAAYARVSTGKDAMRHSLASQVSYYSAMIQSRPEWEYRGVFADEALTGTKDYRQGFQSLLAECRSGNVDLILTKSVSRFARNTVTLLETVRELRGLGVDVYFEEQRLHTLGAEGELLLTLIASFAQAESLSASENMKWRIRKGFENGELMNLRRMLGYDIRKGEIAVNEEQAEIVKGVFRKALEGESLEAIAWWMNGNMDGILGGTFNGRRVRDILSNEKYTGNALLQKTFINNHLEKRKVKNGGQLPMYYAEGTHDAIIDMETFEKAQERLREISKAVSGRKPRESSVFTGKIVCAKCGAPFIRAYNKKTVWQCRTYKTKGRNECDAKQIPDELLKKICCEILGMDVFDDTVFASRVVSIQAFNDCESNILTFTLTNGEVTVKRWLNPSRSESWTPEMKEAAREAGRRKGAKKNG